MDGGGGIPRRMDEQVRDFEVEPTGRSKTVAKRSPLRRALFWLLGLGLLAGLGAAAWLRPLPHATHPARPAGELAPTVRTAAVAMGDLPVELVGLGTVTPEATVTLVPVVGGPLTEVAFIEGQHVKKGDFLAQIDPRPYEVQLAQAQATLARDKALLDQARMDMQRYETLKRQESIARQTAEDQVFLVKQYEAATQLDQAAIDSAKLNLIYCRITAPVDGRIGLRRVDPGNLVQPSTLTGIATVVQMQPITVIFVLPEDSVQRILPRFNAGEKLQVVAFDRSDTKPIATGELYAVGSEINTTTGTFQLRARFTNKDESLFPQQFVNAHLVVETLHGVALVPVAAVQHGPPGSYVYVVGNDQHVKMRPVSVGPSHGDRVSILGGVAAGERVVIDGLDRLHDGMAVAPASDAPAGGGSPPATHAKARKATP